jgi:hypothetical protein
VPIVVVVVVDEVSVVVHMPTFIVNAVWFDGIYIYKNN